MLLGVVHLDLCTRAFRLSRRKACAGLRVCIGLPKLLATPEAIVHIGDRESDIYELFVAGQDAGTHFLFCTCLDRLIGNDGYRVSAVMEEMRVKGLHRIEVRDKKGHVSQAVLELRYRRLRIQPQAGKKKRYPELDLTVLHAQERGTPLGRHAVDWKLIIDLPIASRQQAIEKLHWYYWYTIRWKIETFLLRTCQIDVQSGE